VDAEKQYWWQPFFPKSTDFFHLPSPEREMIHFLTLDSSHSEAELAVGMAIDIMKQHPKHDALRSIKGIQCLKGRAFPLCLIDSAHMFSLMLYVHTDLDRDIKVAISNTGDHENNFIVCAQC
jgi:hypothetical protein